MATQTLIQRQPDASVAAPVPVAALGGGMPMPAVILALASREKASPLSVAFDAHGQQGVASTKWRSVPGWPEYEISENGEVMRKKSHRGTTVCRLLKPNLNPKTGYMSVCLCRNYQQKRVDIHRLVALAFLGPQPSARHMVAHNDGCRTNNKRSNLRWATQGENLADCHSHGTAMVGSRNPMAKLDEIDVKAIRRMKTAGIPRPVIAAGYGIHKRRVFSILSRASWGHV